MSPWQVSFGVSIAVLLPVAYGVTAELAYMAGYWPLLWGYFGIHLIFVPAMVWAGVVFGVYSLARMLVLGDVGSRITVLDKTIREGRAGDAELSRALQREETGDFES